MTEEQAKAKTELLQKKAALSVEIDQLSAKIGEFKAALHKGIAELRETQATKVVELREVKEAIHKLGAAE